MALDRLHQAGINSSGHIVNIGYPAAFSMDALRPEVKLEIGPLASWLPSAKRVITPYAAEEFPELFTTRSCSVIAIAAARTFWEKATIFHQQCHRTSDMPSEYSAHYHDLYRLAESDIKAVATLVSREQFNFLGMKLLKVQPLLIESYSLPNHHPLGRSLRSLHKIDDLFAVPCEFGLQRRR